MVTRRNRDNESASGAAMNGDGCLLVQAQSTFHRHNFLALTILVSIFVSSISKSLLAGMVENMDTEARIAWTLTGAAPTRGTKRVRA